MSGLSRRVCQRLRQSSHSIIYPSIAGIGVPIPVILLSDGAVSQEALEFFLEPNQRNRPLSSKKKMAKAIGLFYDLYHSNYQPALLRPTDNILSEFADILLHGTITVDGQDPTGLFLNPIGDSEYYSYLNTIAAFCLFCRDYYDGRPPFGMDRKFLRLIDSSVKVEQAKFNSRYLFLGHIGGRKTSEDQKALSLAMRGYQRLKGFSQGEPSETKFPPDKIAALIMEGTMRKRVRSQMYWDVYQVREQLIFLLMFFAGLRESEIVHLFVDDIRYYDKKQKTHIILGHPEKGIVNFHGEKITRQEYLRNEFGLLPRTMISGHRAAGWKNLQLLDSKNKQTFGFWLCTEAAEMFWELHKIYMGKLRPTLTGHPYYFVNLGGAEYGAPLSIKKIQQQWSTCCDRIGIQVSKDLGTSPHGARSFYAQAYEEAEANPKIIQSALHHTSIFSQMSYLRKSLTQIQCFLDEGAERIARGLDVQEVNLESLNINSRIDPQGLFGLDI